MYTRPVLIPLLLACVAAAVPGYAQTCLIFSPCSAAVYEWDRQVVDAFLSMHQLPAADRALISLYGRDDLRNDLRGFAFGELTAVLQTPETQRTVAQQAVVRHLSDTIQSLEIAAAQAAADHKKALKTSLCTWKPDEELAKAFAFTYDGTYFCGDRNSLFTGTFPPPFPTIAYFQAYGQKVAYFDPLKNYKNGTTNLREISGNGKLILIFGILGGAALAYAVSGVLILSSTNLRFVFPLFTGLNTATRAVPVATVGLSIALLIITITIVVFAFYEGQAQIKALDQLDADLEAIKNGRVDLGLMSKDAKSSARLAAAFTKMCSTLLGAIEPAPAPLPARAAHDPVFVIKDLAANVETVSDKLIYRNWSNVTSEAQMYGGWFLQKIGLSGAPTYDSFGLKLRFFANNTFYTLDRSGAVLLVTKEEPAATDIDCPVGSDGYTNYTPLSVCKAYSARSVLMELPEGQRMVSVAQPPAFTSSDFGTFNIGGGSAQTIPVQAIGLPTPTIELSSPLPNGVSFDGSSVAGVGKGRFRYDGTSGTPGEFPVTLTARHGGGSVTQSFRLFIGQTVDIIWPYHTLPTQTLGAWTVLPFAVTGHPRPTLTASTDGGWSTAFCGLTPRWTGEGSVVLEGNPENPTDGYCRGRLFADTGSSSRVFFASFRVQVPTQPVIFHTRLLFKAGTPNSQRIHTAPYSNARVFITSPNPLPAWLTLTDSGDGSAVLSGTPPLTAPENLDIPLHIYTRGQPAVSRPENILKLQILKHPEITSAPYGIFNTFATAFYSGSLSLPGTVTVVPNEQNTGLPNGFAVVSSGDNTFQIYGRGDKGGDTTFYLRAGNSLTAKTSETLYRAIIGEPPKLSMPYSLNFYIGQNRALTINADGYPIRPIEGVPGAPGPMNIEYRGALPPGLQFVTTDPDVGPTYGKAVIRGIPTAPGTTMLVIHANNGVIPAVAQSIFLNVTIPGDVNYDGRVNCDDARFVTSRYGKTRGTPEYDWNADYNLDGFIDVRDLAQVSSKLPIGTRCQ
jgi:hypothetical protein